MELRRGSFADHPRARTLQECLREGAFAYVPKPFDLKYVHHMAALATQTPRGPAAADSA